MKVQITRHLNANAMACGLNATCKRTAYGEQSTVLLLRSSSVTFELSIRESTIVMRYIPRIPIDYHYPNGFNMPIQFSRIPYALKNYISFISIPPRNILFSTNERKDDILIFSQFSNWQVIEF